ncbi:MAG: 16S rRNA (guanine(966)-N(2))-methyltransferase RsmD [Deltaproteobacteria bacterium]|nr:MAG: 16S rRNA (guanine(966)-N(2))-methyltransferase RsmD [Deltaproteobacteria bacterium]
MRVTGGRLGGRRLVAPPSGVRPTADRVREALFARLSDLDGVCVLDLYAGTGALGIEALSRGAEHAVFVERSNASLSALRRNLRTLELDDLARVVRGDVRGALRRLAGEGMRFDLVLADPPYDDLALAAPPIEGLVSHGSRRYGDTELEWLEAGDPPPAGEGARDA